MSIDTSDLTFVERELGIFAWIGEGEPNVLEPDLITIAWVEPVQLRDGTWGAGSATFCASEFR